MRRLARKDQSFLTVSLRPGQALVVPFRWHYAVPTRHAGGGDDAVCLSNNHEALAVDDAVSLLLRGLLWW